MQLANTALAPTAVLAVVGRSVSTHHRVSVA
jgi:hypothetical protein